MTTQRDLDASAGQSQMCAAVEDVGGESAHGELGKQKRQVADLEQFVHQPVAFTGQTGANPEERQLGIDPIKRKQDQAFRQSAHLSGVLSFAQKVFTALPWNYETPTYHRGSAVRTGETIRFLTAPIKFPIGVAFPSGGTIL